jgi:CrcB protein
MSEPRPAQTTTGAPHSAAEAIDPDVDLRVSGQRREWDRKRAVLPVIAAGGMLGAGARHAASQAWPAPADSFPWATLGVNAVGCLLIGVLMVFVVEVGGAHPLLRPFAGVGVLGGFTTFSTYAVETSQLLRYGDHVLALAYWAGTLLLALVAVTLGVVSARGGALAAARVRQRRRDRTRPPGGGPPRTSTKGDPA